MVLVVAQLVMKVEEHVSNCNVGLLTWEEFLQLRMEKLCQQHSLYKIFWNTFVCVLATVSLSTFGPKLDYLLSRLEFDIWAYA